MAKRLDEFAAVLHGIDGNCTCCCRRHGKPRLDGEYGRRASNCEDCDSDERDIDDRFGRVCEARDAERRAGEWSR